MSQSKKKFIRFSLVGIIIFLILASLIYGRKMSILAQPDISIYPKEPPVEKIKLPQTFLSLPLELRMERADVSISSPSPRPPKPFMERATSN